MMYNVCVSKLSSRRMLKAPEWFTMFFTTIPNHHPRYRVEGSGFEWRKELLLDSYELAQQPAQRSPQHFCNFRYEIRRSERVWAQTLRSPYLLPIQGYKFVVVLEDSYIAISRVVRRTEPENVEAYNPSLTPLDYSISPELVLGGHKNSASIDPSIRHLSTPSPTRRFDPTGKDFQKGERKLPFFRTFHHDVVAI